MNRPAAFAALALGCAMLLAPALAHAEPAFVTTRLNLQTGPGNEYPVVAFLEPGVQVEVIGCLQGYGWCDVAIGQDRGWVAGAYLQTPYQDRRQPLVQVAPSIGLPVIGFSVGNYWERNYRDRPWYGERSRWDHQPHRAFSPPPGPGWRRDRPDRDHGRPGRDWDHGRSGGDHRRDGARQAGGNDWDRGRPGGPPDRRDDRGPR
jgi:uncharacterized protein YraI